jgi:hypothetical protein
MYVLEIAPVHFSDQDGGLCQVGESYHTAGATPAGSNRLGEHGHCRFGAQPQGNQVAENLPAAGILQNEHVLII